MNRTNRVRLVAAAILAVIFASGVAVGFAVDRGEARAASLTSDVFEPPPGGWIIDQLDLTEEQRSQVDSVVDLYGGQMRELQQEYRPRYLELVDSTRTSISGILTEDQRERYREIEAERRERAEESGRQ